MHGRTKAQAYTGVANWDAIAEVKQLVRVPVIGNGDVRTVADIARLRAPTRCWWIGRNCPNPSALKTTPPSLACPRFWRGRGFRAYRQAAAQAGSHFHYIISSLKQLHWLAQHGLSVLADLFAVLRPPTVVVFSGHMLDQLGRTPPRFPPEREAEVRRAIDEQLDALDARIGYSSAAYGADLLFIEAMQEREAEVNLILPFDMDALGHRTFFVLEKRAPLK